MISENIADTLSALLMIGVGIGIVICWTIGLIGIFKTEEIRKNYGIVIKSGFGILRLFRTMLNMIAIYGFCVNNLYRLAGFYVAVTGENVFWYCICILLNVFFIYEDKKRFYSRCDVKTAGRIIRAERELGFSLLTRLSLIVTIPTMAAAFVLTDTSTYYYDRDTGIIVRFDD